MPEADTLLGALLQTLGLSSAIVTVSLCKA